MTETKPFTFYHPITIRYADLDPQGHVNNAVYLSYLESARLGYYQATGIWQKESGAKTGMVVAHIDIDYLAPILLGESIRVGLRLVRIGNKSLTLAFQIEGKSDERILARGTSVMVAYDNETEKSILFPEEWRKKITQYEDQEGKI